MAEYPDTVVGSLLKLSVGVEIIIKQELNAINSSLIHAEVKIKSVRKIIAGPSFSQSNQNSVLKMMRDATQNPHRTVDFSVAVALFDVFFQVPQNIIVALETLRENRNGILHWEANLGSAIDLARLYNQVAVWLLEFLIKKEGWWLGGAMNIIDPDGELRSRLKRVGDVLHDENLLNVQRRIFRSSMGFAIYGRIRARECGDVTSPGAKPTNETCPACAYPRMQVYETGSKRDGAWEDRRLFLECRRCEFSCSEIEYEALRSPDMQSLV